MSDYLFDQAWQAEKRRLDALSALYDRGTMERLAACGIAAGWSCLAIGAGSGTVAQWMASRVGASGHVVATDLDPRFLEASQNLEVRKHDVVSDPLEQAAFDLIHARAVLQHVRDRDAVIGKLVTSLKPGGWLVLEDIVEPHPIVEPELASWGKFLRGITAGLARSGADPSYGIKLHGAFERAGLDHVSSDARIELIQTGTPSVNFVALSLDHVANNLIAAQLMTAAEVDELRAAFQERGRIMTAAIMICARGTRARS